MKTCIGLLRGINVGGRTSLPMKELVTLLEALGLEDVRTYVQSGNVVFRHDRRDLDRLATRISAAIEKHRGFAPPMLLIDVDGLEQTVRDNPFPEAVEEPKALHANFLFREPPAPDLTALERLKRNTERFVLGNRVLYLHAPEGIARSKLVAGAEKALGVPMTGRNWRTVTKLLEMAQGAP